MFWNLKLGKESPFFWQSPTHFPVAMNSTDLLDGAAAKQL